MNYCLLYTHIVGVDHTVIIVTITYCRRRRGYKKIDGVSAGPDIDDTTHSHHALGKLILELAS